MRRHSISNLRARTRTPTVFFLTNLARKRKQFSSRTEAVRKKTLTRGPIRTHRWFSKLISVVPQLLSLRRRVKKPWPSTGQQLRKVVNFREFSWIYLNLLEFNHIHLNSLESAVFKKRVTDRRTDGPTDRRTDKASYRVAFRNWKPFTNSRRFR